MENSIVYRAEERTKMYRNVAKYLAECGADPRLTPESRDKVRALIPQQQGRLQSSLRKLLAA